MPSYRALRLQAARLFGRRRYDLVVAYGRDEHIFRYARAVGRYVVGFEHRDPAVNRLLDRAVAEELPGSWLHAAEERMRLTTTLGVKAADPRLILRLTEEAGRWAENFLQVQGLGPEASLIGLQVAGFPTKAYRDWPAEYFIALGQAVLA